jgi:hypothetical protein
MLPRFRPHRWRALGRRAFVGLALVAYLATAVGFPVAAPATRPRQQAYPCMNGVCGCPDAETCWRSCCCHSPAERFAWARAHGVEPPAYAEQPTARGWNEPRLRDRVAHKAGGCCAEKTKPLPCPSGRWVVGVSALKCRGLATVWVQAGSVLPPPRPLTWSPSWPAVGRLGIGDATPFLNPWSPPVPPPRSVSC